MRTIGAVAILAVALAACTGTAAPAATTGSDLPSTAATQDAESMAAEAPSPAGSSPAAGAARTYKVGQPIDVTGDFISSDVRVTVDQVKQATKYGAYSKPSKGNIYLAVHYTYQGLEDGATYNPFDWQVFAGDTAVGNFTFVVDGPKPQLESGSLPKSRKASGWLVYEVPKTGKIVLSYGANLFGGDAPTFEVVARSK